jgi:type I protein arginine methyltransferase
LIAVEYSVANYGDMIADRVRMEAYTKALEGSVRPDSVVLDIGTGTGIFALIASRLGARRIFAIEPDEVIEVARETARANGCENSIDFIQAVSTRVTLPERATVLVCDMRGVLPLHRSFIPSVADARARLLADGARVIPLMDSLWAAPIESSDTYEGRIERWDGTPYGLDLGAARRLVVNEWWKVNLGPETLLAEPSPLATLDYRSLSSPNLGVDVCWQVRRAGILHGFAVWFDTELARGISFSNAPGQPRTIYGQAFFPLAEPTEVAECDAVSLRFSASLVGDDYVFSWETRLLEPALSQVKFELKQSNLFAFPLSAGSLHRLRESATPSLSRHGEAANFVLARIDGRHTLGELSEKVEARFPDLFPSPDDPLRFVTEVAQRHCH